MSQASSERHRLQTIAFPAIVALLVGLVSCSTSEEIRSDAGGGGGGGTPGGGNGTVVLLLRDAPADNALALAATVNAVSLTSSGGSASLLTNPVDQEFAGLLLRNTVLAQASVPAGNYTGLQITLANPSVTFFNPPDGTFVTATPAFSTASATVTANVTVTSGSVAPVLLELDLVNSLSFTQPAQGTQLQARFTPSFTARVIDLPTDAGLLARVDDLAGTVSNINAANGTFTFSPLGSGLSLNVFADSVTLFQNVTGLGALTSGSVVDLDARLQSSGSYRAEEIAFRGASSLVVLRGPIVQILALDSSNNVTQFSLVVREATQAVTGAEVGRVVTIRVTAGQTTFRTDPFDLPVGNFTFDPQSLLVGQAVTVALSSTEATNGFPASTITLKQEAFSGTVGQEIGQTTFSFVPGSDLLLTSLLAPRGLNRMTVSTSIATQFENLAGGFGSLRPGQTVAVRGLLFSQFDQPQLVAKRVRGPSQ